MSSLANLLGVLKEYAGASVSNPPANVQQDFQKIAQQIPQEGFIFGEENCNFGIFRRRASHWSRSFLQSRGLGTEERAGCPWL